MAAQEKKHKEIISAGYMYVLHCIHGERGFEDHKTSNTDHRVVDDIEMAHARM